MEIKKADRVNSNGFLNNGGIEGTRTLDTLRDRQVL